MMSKTNIAVVSVKLSTICLILILLMVISAFFSGGSENYAPLFAYIVGILVLGAQFILTVVTYFFTEDLELPQKKNLRSKSGKLLALTALTYAVYYLAATNGYVI